MVRTGVKDTDRGYKRVLKLFGRWKRKKGPGVKIGVQGQEASKSHGQLTNAELAGFHEYGSKERGVPPRPFLGGTVDRNEQKYLNELQAIVERDLDGRESAKAGLGLLGATVVGDVVETLKKSPGSGGGVLPGWAESTKAQKRRKNKQGDPVLWDTGQLVNSLTSEVEGL